MEELAISSGLAELAADLGLVAQGACCRLAELATEVKVAELAIAFGSVGQAADFDLTAHGASCDSAVLAFDLGLVGL